MTDLPERKESLWMIAVSPTIWATHFLLSYGTAAVWCAKFADPGGSIEFVRVVIAIYTALALTGIALTGWTGYRRHSFGRASVPHDEDTPEDRHRFLGQATLLLSALSFVATVYVALTVVFIGRCY